MIKRAYFIIFSLVFLYGTNNNSVKSLIKTAKTHEKRDTEEKKKTTIGPRSRT